MLKQTINNVGQVVGDGAYYKRRMRLCMSCNQNTVEARFVGPPKDGRKVYGNRLKVEETFSRYKRIIGVMMDCLIKFQNNHKETYLQEIQVKQYNINLSSNESISLSGREMDCLHYLSLVMQAKEISRTLGISNRTVECHIKNIRTKSNKSTRSQLISMFLNSDAKLLLDYESKSGSFE